MSETFHEPAIGGVSRAFGPAVLCDGFGKPPSAPETAIRMMAARTRNDSGLALRGQRRVRCVSEMPSG